MVTLPFTQEYYRHLAICDGCPLKQVGYSEITYEEVDTCGVCGCPTAARAATTCPIGNWT